MHSETASAQSLEVRIQRSTGHNFLRLGVFEFLFTSGVAFFLPLTVMPAYLLYLGASKTVVQTTTTALLLMTVLQIWGPTIAHHPQRKRRIVLLWALVGAPWFVYGLGANVLVAAVPVGVASVLFILVGFSGWTCNQLASPGYSEMIFLNIAKTHRGRFSSVLGLTIGIGGLAGSLLFSALMERFPTPGNYHLAFVVGPAVVAASTILLATMHDHQAEVYRADTTRVPFRKLARQLWGDFNFRVFLVFFALIIAAQALGPLFIGYGRDVLAISDRRVGYFTLSFYAGFVLLGSTVPLLADRFGFRVVGLLMAGLFMSGFLLPLLFPGSLPGLYVGYALYAASVILSQVVLANLGHEMLPKIPQAMIVAVGRCLVLPLTVAVGPVSGVLVDVRGDAGYVAAFVAGVLLTGIAALGFLLVTREPRTGEEIHIRIRHP
jgi:MFS family permease